LDFDPKSESQLDSLDDDELIEYISTARDAGHQDHMRTGLAIFVYRRYDQVVNRIRIKVESDEDVEDLAMQVMTDVMTAKFDGSHVGEAVNLITTVTKRRIADFYSSRKPREAPLPTPGGDEGEFGPEPDTGEDFTRAVETADIVSSAIAELSETHALVVRLNLTGLPAEQVAERVNRAHPGISNPMTAPNVHQIANRFRDRISRVLEESER
jgi:RNA polymerase sigma factor (sigma-70 family)